MTLLKSLPFQLCISIVSAFFLGNVLDLYTVSLFYTISSTFIEILLFCLPVVIFVFIMRALLNIPRGSITLLFLIFLGVTLSNCLALTTAYCVGQFTLPFLGLGHSPDFAEKFKSSVEILFSLGLPTLAGTETALMSGVLGGTAMSLLSDRNHAKQLAKSTLTLMSDKISLFLYKVFIPVLPLYVFGFCLKLSYDNALIHLLHQYGKVFVLSLSLVFGYICILYLIGARGNLRNAIKNMKTMLPAGLTAFSTMSSVATMPVTLACTEENTQDRNFTNLVIPSTTNIHMLGDDLTIVLTAMTLLSVFGMPWPDVTSFIPFSLAFSVAKLSCVGIPGASVLVILPVLQGHLGFTPEMVSVLTTIYVLQDPFGTSANVMGNGAFALIIKRIFASLQMVQGILLEPEPSGQTDH